MKTFIQHLILGLFLFATPMVADAQSADKNDDSDDSEEVIEEVIVSGYRKQNQLSISTKRQAFVTTDSVVESELGKLPDFNVGEALRRLPGVTLRYQRSEPRFVSVRGLRPDFTFTSFDGLMLASPDRDSRSTFLDIFPSALASRIDVTKTTTPDMDGNSIGGGINFVTRSAFDYSESTFNFTGQVGTYENNDGNNGSEPSYRADVVWATQMADNWGFIVTGNIFQRDNYINVVESGSNAYWFSQDGTRAENYETDIVVPSEQRLYLYHMNRDRVGSSVKLEHLSDNGNKTWVTAYYYLSEEAENRSGLRTRPSSSTVISPTTEGGLSPNARQLFQNGNFDVKYNVQGVQLGGDYVISDSGMIDFRAGWSGSGEDLKQNWDINDRRGVDVLYEWNGGNIPYVELAPGVDDAFTNYPISSHEYNAGDLEEDLVSAKLDYSWNLQANDTGWGFKTGLKFRGIERDYDYSRDRWFPTDNNTLSFADVFSGDYICYPKCRDKQDFPLYDIGLVYSTWYNTKDDANLWRFDDVSTTDQQRDYSVSEDVAAAYLMGVYTTDNMKMIFGGRYEYTDYESNGRRRVDGVWETTSSEGDYDDFLPSFSLVYEPTDEIVIRGSASRTIGRPRFVDFAVRGETLENVAGEVTISRSNPDLKPRRSTNLDVSFEYYFADNAGIAAIGVFNKDIEDEIFRSTEIEQIMIGGQMVEAIVTQPRNLTDATIFGVEATLSRDLDFLPEPFDGLGFNANATWLDTDYEVLMSDGSIRKPEFYLDQADFVANLVLYYQRGNFEGRMAYNYTGPFGRSIQTTSGREFRDRYTESRNQLDLQFRYSFDFGLTAFFDIWNATDENLVESFGSQRELFAYEAAYGRAFWIGVSYVSSR
ncbi:MAG: TonB-dependent receptor [Xanthomonadales bacterium]|jgi:TonB-dependent receptor|nr:TonB-dependent receptor [Xanthomonadales bacterium]